MIRCLAPVLLIAAATAACAPAPEPAIVPALAPALALAPQRVSQEQWLEAQRQAVLVSEGALSFSPKLSLIIHTTEQELCSLHKEEASNCNIAGLYYHKRNLVLFDSSVEWETNILAWSIIIHEAAHSQQSPDMPVACREAQAYAIQARWLLQVDELEAADTALIWANTYLPECKKELEP